MAGSGRNSGRFRTLGRISTVLGVAGLGSVTAGLFFVNTHSPRDLCEVIFPFAAVSPVFALVAIVLGAIARAERPGRVGFGAGCVSLPLLLFFSMQMGLPPCGERISSNSASVVGSLRTINTAELTYASTYNHGYSSDFASLGPTGGIPSASTANLIDEVLARGRKSGYSFTYSPGARDPKGWINSYTVVARPIKYNRDDSGNRTSFFTDESGVIRQTEEDRPPTAQDSPMGE